MNNEIGRKITSLTLMTIMLAGAFTAVAPSFMPSASAANANLFVSAENSQFQNHFSGPQIVEVVVIDSDIKDTDKGKGEPDLTINGAKLRMLQGTDGNWYGYFADRVQAQKADAIPRGVGLGANKTSLDFGTFCKSDSFSGILSFTSTTGIAVASNFTTTITGTTGGTNGQDTLTTCNYASTGNTPSGFSETQNVVRENKTLNRGVSGKVGQLISTSGRGSQFADQLWPIIQLYDFSTGGNVVVQYNKGGGVQTTSLVFDSLSSTISVNTDRTTYPQGAQVHVNLKDFQLNIDPTDEDSWTFSTLAGSEALRYEVFDENGATGAGLANTLNGNPSIKGNLTGLMFSAGIMTINKDIGSTGTDVLAIQDTADSIITAGGDIDTATTTVTGATYPVQFTETGPNTGIFVTSDESDVSSLKTTASAKRDSTASITYDDKGKTIKVSLGFGVLNINSASLGGEWNSGETVGVSLTDTDANKNGLSDEDLDVNNGNSTLIPAIKIGSPLTLSGASSTACSSAGTTFGSSVDTYSDRLICKTSTATTYPATATGAYFNVTTGITGITFKNWMSANASSAFNSGANTGNAVRHFISFDIRSVNDALSNSATIQKITIGNASNTRQFVIVPSDASDFQQILGLSTTSGAGASGVGESHVANFSASGASKPFGPTSTGNVIIGFKIKGGSDTTVESGLWLPVTVDFLRFGYQNDGNDASERFNDAIYRLELEESGDNTSKFEGTMEYVMLNQLNVNQTSTYTSLKFTSDDVTLAVHEDLTNEDSVRINYLDLGQDGQSTQISSQLDAPTHSGIVSFDKPNYKVADTVTVTLEDQDLNVDSELIDIYTSFVATNDVATDTVGKSTYGRFSSDAVPYGQLLQVKIAGNNWADKDLGSTTCNTNSVSLTGADGLSDSGFTLVETSEQSGIFTGDFQVPSSYCDRSLSTAAQTVTTGKDLEVRYNDFRDVSGEQVEVSDKAGVRANTGSVSFDRTVYPVPFGQVADLSGSATGTDGSGGYSVFPLHSSALDSNVNTAAETIDGGDVVLHIQVNDPDYDTSASGEDKIQEAGAVAQHGPVSVSVSRGTSKMYLATAGFSSAISGNNGKITTSSVDNTGYVTRELGPITETAPNSGIFEFDLTIKYTDGPASTDCPTTTNYVSANNSTRSTSALTRFDAAPSTGQKYCILQGDIITVEYRDPTDASGSPNTSSDSATFDLRNGALQSDKSVYIIGSDMILTLIEPDFDRDTQSAESYDLDLIEWDSDAATCTIGDKKTVGGCSSTDSWNPEPSVFRETGDSTGIFQVVLEIPQSLSSNNLQRGEETVMEYTDWGPSGSDYVGDENEDVNLTIFTSNFGATVELDQKVYTWTDKVYITVVAPDHNMDSNLIDTIGDTSDDAVTVKTRDAKLTEYHLTETGADTGIFTGEVILTGMSNIDADGDSTTGNSSGYDAPAFTGVSSSDSTSNDLGPTNGYLKASNDDGLSVSFEFSEDETVLGSALIRWNIGEVSWLEASYPASGNGVIRIIDPDMNLRPESVDNFKVDVYSDSDAGGIDLTVTETNEATGIFEGTVFFTTTDNSSGARLRVAEGDTVTAVYKDNTLPDPYTTADELDITGTSFIGTVVPPLERAPASNARVVDAFGNTLDSVSVDQQVQISADLTNGQDREQPFAYLVQIQDDNGVTVSLAWITGSLSAGQSFSPALSWVPSTSGQYTATVFVWESVDNPTALSPPVSVDITVS